MSELTAALIKNSFKGQSVAENDHLNHHELYLIINKMNASPFDEETYEQLWDQCKLNSKGEVRLSDFIDYLLKGEELLIQKQHLNAAEIARLENTFKGKAITEFSEQRKYKEQMEGLVEERQAIKNSLAIIRRPFMLPMETLSKQGYISAAKVGAGPAAVEEEEQDIVRQIFEYDSSQTAGVLVIIFYITCALTLLTWLSSFFTCAFLSLTAYTLILLQFSMQTISRKMVKLNLILLSLCSALDVLWFILYTWKLWYLPWAYDFPFMASNYLKFTIVIMVFCFCLRATLFYYYLSQYHIEQTQTYSITLLGRNLNLQPQSQPFSANKNPLSYLLSSFFNKAVQDGDQI